MRLFKRGGLVAVGAVAGAVAMVAASAFGAGTSTGRLSMAAGTHLQVGCPNSLTNSSKTATGETVNCAANSTTTTTVPVTSTTQPSTTTTTVPSSGAGACVSVSPPADPRYNCGPYTYPPDTASNGWNTYVSYDGWNQQPGETSTLTVNNPGSWDDLISDDGSTCGDCVSAYPSVGQAPAKNVAIDAYTQITSTFAENMNATAVTDAHAAYDMWTGPASNIWQDETMIQVDFSAKNERCADGGLPVLATPSFVDPSTGQSQEWDFCEYGGGIAPERIFQLHGISEQSGAVDILAMMRWEQANGYLPAGDGELFGTGGFGFEVNSTGGHPEDFQLTGFSLTALPNP